MITETLKRYKIVTIILFGLLGMVIGIPLGNIAICTIFGLLFGITIVFGEKRQ